MNPWSPFPLRLSVGTVFAVKGWWVLFEELARRAESFAQIGVPFPFLLASTFGTVELVAGVLLFIGLYVRSACSLLVLIEVIAIWPVHVERGFIHGSALNFLLIGGLVSLILSGSGKLSLKR